MILDLNGSVILDDWTRISQGIVTSRYESYDEVNFTISNFEVLKVNDFSEIQIRRYVERSYRIEEEDTESREKEVKNCLEELEKIEKELKTNPLLLTLILILYRNELELPTSKGNCIDINIYTDFVKPAY